MAVVCLASSGRHPECHRPRYPGITGSAIGSSPFTRVRRDAIPAIRSRVECWGSEYLQRFRETGDLNDVTRAHAIAARSLSLQPQGNVQALGVIASSDVAFHRFSEALAAERASLEADPF